MEHQWKYLIKFARDVFEEMDSVALHRWEWERTMRIWQMSSLCSSLKRQILETVAWCQNIVAAERCSFRRALLSRIRVLTDILCISFQRGSFLRIYSDTSKSNDGNISYIVSVCSSIISEMRFRKLVSEIFLMRKRQRNSEDILTVFQTVLRL